MKPIQYDIIINYLEKGIEIFTSLKQQDVWRCVNCVQKEDIYYCRIREIKNDNRKDYFEEDYYDRDEELKFDNIEDLIEYLKSETELSLNNFSKAKNDIYYRY